MAIVVAPITIITASCIIANRLDYWVFITIFIHLEMLLRCLDTSKNGESIGV